jgi:transmembrane sensor
MDKQAKRIAEQAAAFVARSRDENLAQRRERERWLAEDARHARAFEDTRQLWERIDDFRGDAYWQARHAADMAALQRSNGVRSRNILRAAAVLVVLLGGAYLAARFTLASPSVTYTTQVGERRGVMLEDGTQVTLNTDSAIVTHYTWRGREVELQRGEAQFEVTHDAAHPFVVSVAGNTVTALGTRFQVRRGEGAADTVVTLLKGSVAVAHGQTRRILHPNEQARFSTGAGIQVQAVDPTQVDGWLDGWLRFRNVPLNQVVAEANRYSTRKLRLGDPQLANLAVSGNFHAGDNLSVALGIEQVLPVRTETGGTEIVLQPR